MKIAIIVVLGLVVLIAASAFLVKRSFNPSSAQIAVGGRAPDFALPDQNGRTVRLSDYYGKKSVILAFYIKASTPG